MALTQKDMLGYRPDLKYTKPEIYSYRNVELDESKTEDYIDFYRENNIGVLKEVKALQKISDSISIYIEKRSQELDTKVPISDEEKEYIESFEQLITGIDISPINDTITFDIYKKALEIDIEPYTSYVADIFEEYQAGIDGEIEFELYRDVFEIKKELGNLFNFLLNYVCLYIDNNSDIDSLINIENEMINEIDPLAKNSITGLVKEMEMTIEDLIKEGKDVEKLKANVDELNDTIRQKTEILSSESELISVARRITGMLIDILDIIDQTVAINTDTLKYKFSDYEIVSLRLSFDNEKKKVEQIESSRKSIIDTQGKKASLRDLGILSHLKTSFTNPVKSGIKNKNFNNNILERINDGINTLDEQYSNEILNCVTLNETDCLLLWEKINLIIHKHYTRKYIKLREL